MRFLHLSDLHLGKRVNEFSMLEDQAYILKEILNIIDEQKVEAVLIAAADALSAARPGARRETLETYITRLQKLEEIANNTPGVEKSYAIQAGREIRVIARPEEKSDDDIPLLAREISKKIESELQYPGQIKVNVIRETRAIDYAK